MSWGRVNCCCAHSCEASSRWFMVRTLHEVVLESLWESSPRLGQVARNVTLRIVQLVWIVVPQWLIQGYKTWVLSCLAVSLSHSWRAWAYLTILARIWIIVSNRCIEISVLTLIYCSSLSHSLGHAASFSALIAPLSLSSIGTSQLFLVTSSLFDSCLFRASGLRCWSAGLIILHDGLVNHVCRVDELALSPRTFLLIQ